MMFNYGCHTTPMPPSVGDVFFLLTWFSILYSWHKISDMGIELGCMPVCFFLGGLYNDNVRTMLMTAAQVMMSTLFGLVCWGHNGMVVDRLILQFFSTMATQILKVAIFLESMVTCAGNFFSKAMRCGVKYLVPPTLLSTDFGCEGSLL